MNTPPPTAKKPPSRAPRKCDLAALTPRERADYDILRTQGRFLQREALASIGRLDVLTAP